MRKKYSFYFQFDLSVQSLGRLQTLNSYLGLRPDDMTGHLHLVLSINHF